MSDIATGKLVIWMRLQAERITPAGNRTSIMLSAAADRLEQQEQRITELEREIAAAKEVQKRLSIISAASVGCGSIVTSGTAGRSGEGWKDRCVMKDEPKGLISVKIQSRSPVKCIDCIYWAKNKEMDDSHYCKCKESRTICAPPGADACTRNGGDDNARVGCLR